MRGRAYTIVSVITVLAILGLAACAIVAKDLPTPLKSAKADTLGAVLVGPNGMTLYTYVNDKEPGKSVCNGSCAVNWPPFKADANVQAAKEPLSVITRDDGSRQYAYKGQPLYYWRKDQKPGDITGHNAGNVWLVAKP